MKKFLKKIKHIFPLFLLGGILGWFISYILERYIDKNECNPLITVLIFFVFLILCYQLQIILHELGHLLFGLLTGYKFISFRIGNIIWIKNNEKIVKGRYKLQGTGGQCIMLPPELKNGFVPYLWYNLGGVIINLSVSIISILIEKQTRSYTHLSVMLLFCFALTLTGFFCAITNGIPYYSNAMVNDGYHIMSLKKSRIVQKSYYVMLKTNALQVKGKRIGELPYEWFLLPEEADLSNPINASIRILEGNWYYDKLQFEEARICYETLLNSSVTILNVLKRELLCELLFFELVSFQREEVIHSLYTKELIRYIEAMKFMINKQKLRYACAVVIDQDLEKANKIYTCAWQNKENFCIKGEAEMEFEVLEWTKKYFENKKILDK